MVSCFRPLLLNIALKVSTSSPSLEFLRIFTSQTVNKAMTFKEFVKISEDNGLFVRTGPTPGPNKNPPHNVDIYLHQYGSGGLAPATATSPAQLAGSGAGLGNQRPRQMKKMKKS